MCVLCAAGVERADNTDTEKKKPLFMGMQERESDNEDQEHLQDS